MLALHVRKYCPARQHHTKHVDVHHLTAVLERSATELEIVVNGRIVYQGIDPPEAVGDLLSHCCQLRLICNVGPNCDGSTLPGGDLLLEVSSLLEAGIDNATAAPSSTNRSAYSRPIPCAAPVMIATLP